MLTLGLAGGLDPVHELRLDTPANFTYDSAAVLVEDGTVIAAIEQARLDRIKRSNKFPGAAIRFCLEHHGVRPEDLDRIAYYAPEDAANQLLAQLYLAMPQITQRVDARTLLAMTLAGELGGAMIDPAKLRFYSHKLMHAAGAMAQSGFDEALVLILDNSGGLFRARREADGKVVLEELIKIPSSKSTTKLCQTLLPFMGLGHLDNQTAIAMAQDGDPSVFRDDLRTIYELLPDGDYALYLPRVASLLGKVEPRGKDGPGQQHKDLAAALQEAQEEIVLHVLRHHRGATALPHLCLAGGVVENSRTNGRVLAAELFADIFVHPSVTDAGCALGAALEACEEAGAPAPKKRLRHAYWGTDVGENERIEAELTRWHGFLEHQRPADVARHTAGLLADGAVVGWVQGRSEFSPRSLGNRSVVADPRPAANRARVDALLERPPGAVAVTPSVLGEDAATCFELPDGVSSFPFRAFALAVREDKREILTATLDKDGTAWPQTVWRETNPRYWALIDAFKELTGVPALLDTSFCSRDEPIVDSVEDAITTFLTTGLDYLVIGDLVARRTAPAPSDWLALRVSLPLYVKLQQTRRFATPRRLTTGHAIRTTCDAGFSFPLSPELYAVLLTLEGEATLGELLRDGDSETLISELQKLWRAGLIRLHGRAD